MKSSSSSSSPQPRSSSLSSSLAAPTSLTALSSTGGEWPCLDMPQRTARLSSLLSALASVSERDDLLEYFRLLLLAWVANQIGYFTAFFFSLSPSVFFVLTFFLSIHLSTYQSVYISLSLASPSLYVSVLSSSVYLFCPLPHALKSFVACTSAVTAR